MKRVKFMSNENQLTLEEHVNEFLEDKVLVDIKFNIVEGSYFTKYFALIIYEEWQ